MKRVSDGDRESGGGVAESSDRGEDECVEDERMWSTS